MGDSVEIMNLNSSESEGMTPLFNVTPQQQQPGSGGANGDPRPPPPPLDSEASAPSNPVEKKVYNNIKKNKMDSTPLSDIMGNEVMDGGMMMGPPQDPRMMTAQPMIQPQMMMQHQQPPQQQQQQVTAPPSKNPMNLTDEQVQALFVGVCAIIAFSRPVQDKLANFVPQFVGENGSRSTVGLVVTGLVATLAFYFGQRFVIKN
jgi:hypothetical protein